MGKEHDVNVQEILYKKPVVRGAQILEPPGWRLRSIARTVFGQRALDRVFGPMLDDHVAEWSKAASSDDPIQTLFVRIRCVVSFWTSAFLHCGLNLLDIVKKALRLG